VDWLAAGTALVVSAAFFSLMALIAWLNGSEEEPEHWR
jgi:hypothetical protein